MIGIPGAIQVGVGSTADTVTPLKPLTLAEQMERDNEAFYDSNGSGFAVIASYNQAGTPDVYIRGIFERKPIITDAFTGIESYATTFRAPKSEVGGATQGAFLTLDRKSYEITHVEHDSNGDTVLTLSLNSYGQTG